MAAGSSGEKAEFAREAFLYGIRSQLLSFREAADIVVAYDRGDTEAVNLILTKADLRHDEKVALAARARAKRQRHRSASPLPSSPPPSTQPGSVTLPDGCLGL